MENKQEIKYAGLLNNVIEDRGLKALTGQTLDNIASILSNTFGPYGGSTIMDRFPEPPVISKDGFTVLNALRYPGPVENAILELVRKIATNQVIKVGDGSTSAIISSNEIFKRVKELTEAIKTDERDKVPTHLFAQALDRAASKYKEELLALAKPVSDDMNEIRDIATIAINNDTELGEVVYKAFSKAGKDVEVTFEKDLKQKEKATVEFEKGIKIDYGFFVDRGYTNENNISVKLDKTNVIIFNQKIEGNFMVDLFVDIVQYYLITGSNLTLIINGLGDRARDFVNKTFSREHIENINIIYMPQNNDLSIQKAQDIALCCDCTVIDKDYVQDLKFYPESFYEKRITLAGRPQEIAKLIHEYKGQINEEMLDYIGTAGEITSFSNFTIIKDGEGLNTQKDIIKKEIENEKKRLDIMKKDAKSYTDELSMMCNKRIATLSNTLVSIKVGGATEEELNATYDLIEDAVKASKSALKYGVVLGGNYAILKAFYSMLDKGIIKFKFPIEKSRMMDGQDFNAITVMKFTEDKKEQKLSIEHLEKVIVVLIAQAFFNMIKLIYANGEFGNNMDRNIVLKGIESNSVFNVAKGDFDNRIRNSANTEIEILNSSMSIISMLMNSNQIALAKAQDKLTYGHFLTQLEEL